MNKPTRPHDTTHTNRTPQSSLQPPAKERHNASGPHGPPTHTHTSTDRIRRYRANASSNLETKRERGRERKRKRERPTSQECASDTLAASIHARHGLSKKEPSGPVPVRAMPGLGAQDQALARPLQQQQQQRVVRAVQPRLRQLHAQRAPTPHTRSERFRRGTAPKATAAVDGVEGFRPLQCSRWMPGVPPGCLDGAASCRPSWAPCRHPA